MAAVAGGGSLPTAKRGVFSTSKLDPEVGAGTGAAQHCGPLHLQACHKACSGSKAACFYRVLRPSCSCCR